MSLIVATIIGELTGALPKLFTWKANYSLAIIKDPAQFRSGIVSQIKWGFILLLLVGIMGCSSASPADESTSLLPVRLAEAIPAAPEDPELMVKALQSVFEKWALAGHLEDSPAVLAAFYNLLVLSDLEPVETMQSWLIEAKAEAGGGETADFGALEADLATDFQPLTLEESFFNLWQHANENPNAAADAGVRLALIAAVGDENLQREIVRAWGQLIE